MLLPESEKRSARKSGKIKDVLCDVSFESLSLSPCTSTIVFIYLFIVIVVFVCIYLCLWVTCPGNWTCYML